MTLNHYAINQIIGGRMVAGRRPRLGRFGLLSATAELLKYRPRPGVRVQFDVDTDRAVFDAFMATRDGAAPEMVLLDGSLASKFHSEARKLGAHASAADLNRRLQNIRKNPARYKKFGMLIPEATKIVPHPSIVPQYAHVIEFALARLRSRYGVTIDDVLIDPVLTAEYELMVRSVASALSSLDIRLAALYIRKTRFIKKSEESIIDSLNVDRIERDLADIGTANSIKSKDIPSGKGLIEILEDDRHLYISRNENLQASVEQIIDSKSLRFMSNDFWQPKLDHLQLRIYSGDRYLNIPVSQWQLKLIRERKPVFNWPISA